MARILVSEVEPGVRRSLVDLIERLGHEAVVLREDVVVPPRADVLLVDPVAPQSVEHARLVRAFFPELPIVCLNPMPVTAGFLGRGATFLLPKPFEADELDAALERAMTSFGARALREALVA